MRRILAALVAALALPAVALASPQTLVVPTLFGEYRLGYDDAHTNEPDLRELVVLSPHLAGWTSMSVAPRLELCVIGDAEYMDCRTRGPQSATFLFNARVNLGRGAAALARLRALRAPAELEPVVTWLQRSLAFSLWLEETKLDFYRSRDVAVLRRRYEDAEPARGCAAVVSEIAQAGSLAAEYSLVALPWHNCVNDLVRRRLGDYPIDAWQRFLSAWGITERFVDMVPRRGGADAAPRN